MITLLSQTFRVENSEQQGLYPYLLYVQAQLNNSAGTSTGWSQCYPNFEKGKQVTVYTKACTLHHPF